MKNETWQYSSTPRLASTMLLETKLPFDQDAFELKKLNIHEVCPDILHDTGTPESDAKSTSSSAPTLVDSDDTASETDLLSAMINKNLNLTEDASDIPFWPANRPDEFYPESDNLPWHYSYIDAHMAGMSAPVR